METQTEISEVCVNTFVYFCSATKPNVSPNEVLAVCKFRWFDELLRIQ